MLLPEIKNSAKLKKSILFDGGCRKKVAEKGVEVLAYGVQFLQGETPLGIELNRKLSVILNFVVR